MPDFTRLVPLAAALATMLAAPPARADELADLINAYRAAPGSCAGRPAAPAGALAVEPALARIRIGPGTFLESALQRAGYEAAHAEAITVTGPTDARAAVWVRNIGGCKKLFNHAAYRRRVGAHAALFLDNVPFLIKFALDRLSDALAFEVRPELETV